MKTQEVNELKRKLILLLKDYKNDKADTDLTCLGIMALLEKEIEGFKEDERNKKIGYAGCDVLV